MAQIAQFCLVPAWLRWLDLHRGASVIFLACRGRLVAARGP
jgi:hypothetical protein